MKRVFWSAVLGGILLQSTAQGDWKNMLDSATKAIGGQQGLTTSALSNSEIAAGLREALANGVRTAVETLGQTDGFWRNELVRIGMPDSVEKVADAVRKFGGASYGSAEQNNIWAPESSPVGGYQQNEPKLAVISSSFRRFARFSG